MCVCGGVAKSIALTEREKVMKIVITFLNENLSRAHETAATQSCVSISLQHLLIGMASFRWWSLRAGRKVIDLVCDMMIVHVY